MADWHSPGPFKKSVKVFLSSVCGVDLEDDDDPDGALALRRKLMNEPAYEDAGDEGDEPASSGLASLGFPGTPWLPSALGQLTGDHSSVETPTPSQYAPPTPTSARVAEAPASDASPPSNPLQDLNALMARVEELEAAGDLDAAARLLSGAVARR